MDFIQENQNPINLGKPERLTSLAGGLLLLLYAAKRRTAGALIPAAVGAGLLYRSATGHSSLYQKLGRDSTHQEQPGIHVTKAVTVACSPQETYQFWRNLENLPRFMEHLESVQSTGNGRSHWIVKAPAGVTLQWDAHVTEDRPNELIAWETLPHATVQHRGHVQFRPAPREQGTEVIVTLDYQPPGGIVGQAFAQLANVVTAQQIKEEIRRFKHVLETGETPTIEGQPAGPH